MPVFGEALIPLRGVVLLKEVCLRGGHWEVTILSHFKLALSLMPVVEGRISQVPALTAYCHTFLPLWSLPLELYVKINSSFKSFLAHGILSQKQKSNEYSSSFIVLIIVSKGWSCCQRQFSLQSIVLSQFSSN